MGLCCKWQHCIECDNHAPSIVATLTENPLAGALLSSLNCQMLTQRHGERAPQQNLPKNPLTCQGFWTPELNSCEFEIGQDVFHPGVFCSRTLTFTRNLRPMIIGSSSGWLMLEGMMARPLATSERTNSGSIFSRAAQNCISSVMIPCLA